MKVLFILDEVVNTLAFGHDREEDIRIVQTPIVDTKETVHNPSLLYPTR